ncbi:family 20 glycosylhydrolase [Saccharomonospora sp. NPDC006951]
MGISSGGKLPALIPNPGHVRWTGRELAVGKLNPTGFPEVLARYREAIAELVALVSGGRGPTISVRFETMGGGEEEYGLSISATRGVTVRAVTGVGALHAIRTLIGLWESGETSTLPEVEILDGPDFAVRGVFVESFAGTDLMELGDWRRLIDRMGKLKLNRLGISIYGCWDIHHEGDRSEWLFLPLHDFPELVSPQRVLTWDPLAEAETEIRYIPRMFESDFFAEIVAYASERGIQVVPQLGGPGHSTLIPRLVPTLSAKDETGSPTGYGYCVTAPEAVGALRQLTECLVRQHLAPNNVRELHVAGDEYYPIRNVDPDDRSRVVSPYCQCEGCANLTPGELLVEYFLIVGRVLDAAGITMINWHDTLIREDVLDVYLARVEAIGLRRPVIAWWKYNDPIPAPQSAGGEVWSCPTTGIASFLFHQDFTANIENVLRRGREVGAVGAMAYSFPDPSDFPNYAALADMSWNLDGGGRNGFRERWARATVPADSDAALCAFETVATITACYPLMLYVLDNLLPFFSTSMPGHLTYPDDLVRVFSSVQPPLGDVLRQCRDTIREGTRTMPMGRETSWWGDPIDTWKNENRRLADSIDLFLDVLALARRDDPPGPADAELLMSKSHALLRLAAATKPGYLAPITLREHWGFVRRIHPALERIRASTGVEKAESWYAWQI